MIKKFLKEESKEFYDFLQLLLSDDEQDELMVNTTLNFWGFRSLSRTT